MQRETLCHYSWRCREAPFIIIIAALLAESSVRLLHSVSKIRLEENALGRGKHKKMISDLGVYRKKSEMLLNKCFLSIRISFQFLD